MKELIREWIHDTQAKPDDFRLVQLFGFIKKLCNISSRPVVLFIDEVDSASNNQVFLDFLAQLRSLYMKRKKNPKIKTFHSVILAGVTDVKNLKRKIRPEEGHKVNSPWNIAADFTVDMTFSADGIAGMLSDYEEEHHVGMDVKSVAQEIRDYTGGYPFLVCRICQILDKELVGTERFRELRDTWTEEGVNEAVRIILFESNTLFDSLIGKLYDNEKLCDVLKSILFGGQSVSYHPDDLAMADAFMFGFIRVVNRNIIIANRIFETRLYNYFLGESEIKFHALYTASSDDRELFVKEGHLDMDKES